MQADHHLVYADIGPSPLNTTNNIILNTFELDDSRVEYAQINHTCGFLEGKVEHSESVIDKQTPVPGICISSSCAKYLFQCAMLL